MYVFSCDYVKAKDNEKAKLCYLDTDSFIVHVKTENVYVGIAENIDKRFDTSNYELKRPLSKRKKKTENSRLS